MSFTLLAESLLDFFFRYVTISPIVESKKVSWPRKIWSLRPFRPALCCLGMPLFQIKAISKTNPRCSRIPHRIISVTNMLSYISRVISLRTAFQVFTRLQQYDSSVLSSREQIPGGSPLTYCSTSSASGLYQIKSIELYLNPLLMYLNTSLLWPY